MKKLILTGLSFLFALTLTFAQEANPEQKAQETVVKLTEKLTLTTEQQTAVYPIILEAKTAKAAIKANEELSEEAAKEELAKITADADTKVAAQLTDEQKALYAKYIEERNAAKE